MSNSFTGRQPSGVQGAVLGNVVHDIGPAGCTHVQGIYMSTSDSIKNNVVYRIASTAIQYRGR